MVSFQLHDSVIPITELLFEKLRAHEKSFSSGLEIPYAGQNGMNEFKKSGIADPANIGRYFVYHCALNMGKFVVRSMRVEAACRRLNNSCSSDQEIKRKWVKLDSK